jgi:hypothetical protein
MVIPILVAADSRQRVADTVAFVPSLLRVQVYE